MSFLQQGDKAPDFTSKDQNGNTVTLNDFKGKKWFCIFIRKIVHQAVLPKLCDFRDNYQGLKAQGIEVLGVSIDDEKSHQKFITKYDLPFTLLADTDKSIVEAYGVWAEKSMYGKKYMGTNRTTFIIDEDGNIAHIITKVDTKAPTAQVLELIK